MAEARRWAWIADKLVAELSKFERRFPVRTLLLRRMIDAARSRDGVALTEVGAEYARRFRVLPPGVYAIGSGPQRPFYLDGDELAPGERVGKLSFQVVHAQVYR